MQVTKPHKAVNVDLQQLRFPCAALPKVDGVRGVNILPFFTGRTLKRFRNDKVTAEYTDPLLFGLDGELCNGRLTSPTLCSDTVSYLNSYSFNTSGPVPKLYCFDWITPETAHLAYIIRWKLLEAHISDLHDESKFGSRFANVRLMPEFTIIHTLEEALNCHTQFIASGYEGTIFRYLLAPHKNGRSTEKESAYTRLKDFLSEEVEILGLEEAQMNLNEPIQNALGHTERSSAKAGLVGKGMIGSLLVRRTSGEIITIGPGSLTRAERIEYFEEPQKIIGRFCTFKHMPYGAKDKPRFPLFANFRLLEDL